MKKLFIVAMCATLFGCGIDEGDIITDAKIQIMHNWCEKHNSKFSHAIGDVITPGNVSSNTKDVYCVDGRAISFSKIINGGN